MYWVFLLAGAALTQFAYWVEKRPHPRSHFRSMALAAAGDLSMMTAMAWIFTTTMPTWHGLPVACAPGLAAILMLMDLGVRSRDKGAMPAVRSASLTPRPPVAALTPDRFIRLVLLGTVIIVGSIILGQGSSAAEDGLFTAYTYVSSQGPVIVQPYPGWLFTFSLIGLLPLLYLSSWLAARRVNLLPVLFTDPTQDIVWRGRLGELVLRVLEAGLLSEIGVLLWMLGPLFQTIGADGGTAFGAPAGAFGMALQGAAVILWTVAAVRVAHQTVRVRSAILPQPALQAA
ncbi:hypothetical protein QFZ52_000149 [Arthrobacter woluwensis]|uniref:hypothetical protein n=1 Tax=Arthrobacter woluwensis TaxID=156980 RepID=UPI00277EA499|nr:hypothetical protein [Arthrobacter woluwensis]MDQ0707497.1 hypothetical protein [Arthrobacter woluwensis]